MHSPQHAQACTGSHQSRSSFGEPRLGGRPCAVSGYSGSEFLINRSHGALRVKFQTFKKENLKAQAATRTGQVQLVDQLPVSATELPVPAASECQVPASALAVVTWARRRRGKACVALSSESLDSASASGAVECSVRVVNQA